MIEPLSNDWAPLLQPEFEQSYFIKLRQFLTEEYRTQQVYPAPNDIFNAFRYTPFASTRVVILGQDPYHGPGQAHGLSFSVKPGAKLPPSLKNIFKELQAHLGCRLPNNGCLIPWAEQGVLLLNTVMTVREGKPNSHKGKGWETFTDRVLKLLNDREQPVVFILWGSPAQAKQKWIDTAKHCIIQSVHPSPLSAGKGFFGSKPFSETNRLLRRIGSPEIDWQIRDV